MGEDIMPCRYLHEGHCIWEYECPHKIKISELGILYDCTAKESDLITEEEYDELMEKSKVAKEQQ